MNQITRSAVLISCLLAVSCADDNDGLPPPSQDGSVHDGGVNDASSSMDASSNLDANFTPDANAAPDASEADAGSAIALKVERGRYLVENVAACGDCHTPRDSMGVPDMTRAFSGVDCFVESTPDDPNTGCLSAANLTNDETGLKNRSDEEIKDLFLKGMRPDGKALFPVMPYSNFGNMTDADADAIVAFLRTLPAVSHMVKAAQAPFADQLTPAPTWPDALIPQPSANYVDVAAAKRGRYLAGSIGVCLECHTPHDTMDTPLVMRPFEGGRAFTRQSLGLPPVFPDVIYSSNITPDDTGIKKYDVAAIVKVLHQSIDDDGKPLCPPMPSGPMAAFGGLTDGDAQDIAHYLLSLAPKANTIPNGCTPPGAP